MRVSRIQGAKKMIDRTKQAGIESQCHQLLFPARSYQDVQLTKEPTYQVGFFVPKFCVKPKLPAPANPHESGKFNHVKATTQILNLAIRFFQTAIVQ